MLSSKCGVFSNSFGAFRAEAECVRESPNGQSPVPRYLKYRRLTPGKYGITNYLNIITIQYIIIIRARGPLVYKTFCILYTFKTF